MSLLLAHHMMILIKVVLFVPLSTFALVCYPMSLLLAPKWVPLLVGYFCNCNCNCNTLFESLLLCAAAKIYCRVHTRLL